VPQVNKMFNGLCSRRRQTKHLLDDVVLSAPEKEDLTLGVPGFEVILVDRSEPATLLSSAFRDAVLGAC
jgi:hypothetical protein